MKNQPEYKTKIFTGIRPTGGLTVANYMGAVVPLLQLQEDTGGKPLVFVADLHALTDHEPYVIRKNTIEVVADYLALGLDPKKVNIFIQSDIKAEIYEMTALLSRHVTVAELIRIPTLKDKIKKGNNPETANALLALYPIIMAADILLPRAEFVPVGDDQQPHIEITRLLARRFNKRYGDTLPLPKPQTMEPVRILSLSGNGKMSKSQPEGAIFLTDSDEEVKNKVKRAQTAFGGEMPEVLVSHFMLARGLTKNDDILSRLDQIEDAHMKNEKVMGEFKTLLADIIVEFLKEYRTTKEEILSDGAYIAEILEEGRLLAEKNAKETMELIHEAMGE